MSPKDIIAGMLKDFAIIAVWDVAPPKSIKSPIGEIIEINRFRNLAKVKGANMQKKHKKATKENKGGIISKEGFIHLSNLKNFEENKKGKK